MISVISRQSCSVNVSGTRPQAILQNTISHVPAMKVFIDHRSLSTQDGCTHIIKPDRTVGITQPRVTKVCLWWNGSWRTLSMFEPKPMKTRCTSSSGNGESKAKNPKYQAVRWQMGPIWLPEPVSNVTRRIEDPRGLFARKSGVPFGCQRCAAFRIPH